MADIMTKEEFEDAVTGIHRKLTPAEVKLLDTVIAGAEVNHSVAYAIVAAVLGFLGGLAVMAWWL